MNHSFDRFDMLGTPIDSLTLTDAIGWTRARAQEPGPMLLVHTVNVDHIVTARRDATFTQVSSEAALSVADGMPVVWGARLLGRRLPERVAGVDLFRGLAASEDGARIPTFLFGAMPDVAERAAELLADSPGIEIVGVLSPEPADLRDPEYNRRAIEQINSSGARVLGVALGAPKQELWLSEHADALRVRVGLGIGATLDFIAGASKRAPRWMQRIGLEWFHRMLTEPLRLGKRYLVRDPVFAVWLAREFVRARILRRPARAWT